MKAIQRSSEMLEGARSLTAIEAAGILPNYKQWREYVNQTSALEIEAMLADKYQIMPETMVSTKQDLLRFKEEYEATTNELKAINQEIRATKPNNPEFNTLMSKQTRLVANKANQDGLYQGINDKLQAIENAESFLAQ